MAKYVKILYNVGNTFDEPNNAYINNSQKTSYKQDGTYIYTTDGTMIADNLKSTENIQLPNPTDAFGLEKVGYKFKNWLMVYYDPLFSDTEQRFFSSNSEYFESGINYSGNEFKNMFIEDETDTFNTTCMLMAQWEPIVTKITLDNQGMRPSTSTVYVKYGVGWYSDEKATNQINQITTIPTYTRRTFAGYYLQENGNGEQIINRVGEIKENSTRLFSTSTGTLYAYNWDGADPSDNILADWHEDGSLEVAIIYQKGFNTSRYVKVGTALTWESIESAYQDPSNLSGKGFGLTYFYYDQTSTDLYDLPPGPQIQRKGQSLEVYSMAGWGFTANQSTISYPAEYGNPASFFCQPKDITLYALWERTLTITFNLNDGTSNSFQKIFRSYAHENNGFDIPCSFEETSPTRKGYNFLGWSTSATATSATYFAGQTHNISKSGKGTSAFTTTLYAVWEKQKVDVIYNYDTDKSESLTQSFEYNDTSENSQWFGRAADGSLLWIPEEGVDIYTSKYGFGPWSWIGKKIIGWIDENSVEYKNSLINPNSEYEDKYVTATNPWIIAHDNETINLYPILDPNGAANIYIDSQWKVGLPYIFIEGEWKQALPYIYNGSEWKIGV